MNTQENIKTSPLRERLVYTVDEACHLAALSRSSLYEHIKIGRLRTLKIGNCRRIAANDLRDWLDGFREQTAA